MCEVFPVPRGTSCQKERSHRMATSVNLPALGESVTEGTVTRWLKSVGDEVAVDEPLLEVSTDKVDTEIPSPASGVLTKIVVGEDETVAVGAELAVVGDADESSSEAGSSGGESAGGSGDAARSAAGSVRSAAPTRAPSRAPDRTVLRCARPPGTRPGPGLRRRHGRATV